MDIPHKQSTTSMDQNPTEKRKHTRKATKRKLLKPRSDAGTHLKNVEFELYAFFLSLPAQERNEEFGFSKDIDFGGKYKINPATLTEWKKDDKLWDIRNHHMKALRRHTVNILAALARKATKRGDAFEVMTWMKLMEGWTDKSGLDLTSKGDKIEGFQIIIHNPNDGNHALNGGIRKELEGKIESGGA